jgi:hypothetical protein
VYTTPPPPHSPPSSLLAVATAPLLAIPDQFHLNVANVIIGDCRKELLRLAIESIDLIATDPPYRIGQNYGSHYDDGQSEAAFLAMLEEAMARCRRALKPSGSLFVVMGANLQAEVLMMLKRLGFHWRGTIVWYETFGQSQERKFTPSWRAIHYVVKDPANYTFNADAIRVPSGRQLEYSDKRANLKGKVPDDTWPILKTWALMPYHQTPEMLTGELDTWQAIQDVLRAEHLLLRPVLPVEADDLLARQAHQRIAAAQGVIEEREGVVLGQRRQP